MILTIKKHADHWREVIQTLEMLGGENRHNFDGSEDYNYFTLEINDEICGTDWITDDHKVYTLEEFKAEYPFNLGDYVFMAGYTDSLEISGIGWATNEVLYEVYTGDYRWVSVDNLFPVIKDQASKRSYRSQNEVSRYLLENPIKNAQELLAIEKELTLSLMSLPENITIHSRGIRSSEFLEWFYSDPIPSDDTLLPTTYEECCEVLGIKGYQPFDVRGYKNDLVATFQNLLICRNAWWKVLGWKPDPGDENEEGLILIFPTDRIKERFYENFRDLIEYIFKGLLSI